MPDQPDETEDDASEIASSLVHTLRKEPAEGPRLYRVTEQRGIRAASWIFDPLLVDPEVETASADTHALLFMAANRHLCAVGQMDFSAVVETAEICVPSGEYPTPEKISQHFAMWANGLKNQKGSLSIDAIAARFIQAHNRLFMLLNENLETHMAAFAYADAWHWLHMELFGEHELAASAEVAEQAADAAQQLAAKAIAGRIEGPQAKKRYAALRNAVIATEYEKYRQAEPNEDRRTSAKSAAAQILDPVNATLNRENLGSLELSTLEKRLRKIINEDE